MSFISAHRGGDFFDKENSLGAIRKSLQHPFDIIELDVRKSKDNILFCHHGKTLQYCFPGHFFKNRNWDRLKQEYEGICKLTDAAKLISDKCILSLDIKDFSISPSEIKACLKGIKIKEVWILAQSWDYHIVNSVLPKVWKRIYNGLFRYDFKRILDAKVEAVGLFFWDFTSKKIRVLREEGVDVALERWFIPKKKYLDLRKKWDSLWITPRNKEELSELVKK